MRAGLKRVADTNNNVAYAMDRVAVSNDRLRETIADTSAKELEVKDRVDISLKEYEEMKKTIEDLRSKVKSMSELFDNFKIPYDLPIIPGSVDFYHNDNIIDGTRTYRCEFKVNWLDLPITERR